MKEVIKIRNNTTNEIMELRYENPAYADEMEDVLEFIGAEYTRETERDIADIIAEREKNKGKEKIVFEFRGYNGGESHFISGYNEMEVRDRGDYSMFEYRLMRTYKYDPEIWGNI